MSSSVVFKWCDGGDERHIRLEKASLAYRSIMTIIATEQQHLAVSTGRATAQTSEAAANGPVQIKLERTVDEDRHSAVDAPRETSPGLGPSVKKSPEPSAVPKPPNVRNGNRAHEAQCDECASWVAGVRYNCAVCEDYDLCSKCEESGLHDHHIMLRFGRVAYKVFNWTNAGQELHGNLVKLQKQLYPPAQKDGEGRPVDAHRDPHAVHDATCKECGEQVVGVRYKCAVCVDHDICAECEANGVHDKHITFRFAGVVNEITSWKLVERRFGLQLHDGLKDLQRKITGPPGTKITSKDIDELYASMRKNPEATVDVQARQTEHSSGEEPPTKQTRILRDEAYGGPLSTAVTAPEGTRSGNVANENVAPAAPNGVVKNEPPASPDVVMCYDGPPTQRGCRGGRRDHHIDWLRFHIDRFPGRGRCGWGSGPPGRFTRTYQDDEPTEQPPHQTNGGPDVDVKVEPSTPLSQSAVVNRSGTERAEGATGEDPVVPNGLVKTEPPHNPDDRPTEAVEAIVAAVTEQQLNEGALQPPVVKAEPPTTLHFAVPSNPGNQDASAPARRMQTARKSTGGRSRPLFVREHVALENGGIGCRRRPAS